MIDGGYGGQVDWLAGLELGRWAVVRREGSIVSFVIPWLCLAGFVAGLTARQLGSWLQAMWNRMVSLAYWSG